jgi:hypothetical protein
MIVGSGEVFVGLYNLGIQNMGFFEILNILSVIMDV